MLNKGLLLLICFTIATMAQNDMVNVVNAKRKQAGITTELREDGALSIVCEKVVAKTNGLAKGAKSLPTAQECRANLWNNHVYDIDVKVFDIEGKTTEEALDAALQNNDELKQTLKNGEYNRIGFYEEKGAEKNRIRMIMTKRDVEFDKAFDGEISEYASGTTRHILRIKGRSLVGGIGYEVGSFPSIDGIKGKAIKKTDLGAEQRFSIEVDVNAEVQKQQYGGVALFNASGKAVAFVKF